MRLDAGKLVGWLKAMGMSLVLGCSNFTIRICGLPFVERAD